MLVSELEVGMVFLTTDVESGRYRTEEDPDPKIVREFEVLDYSKTSIKLKNTYEDLHTNPVEWHLFVDFSQKYEIIEILEK